MAHTQSEKSAKWQEVLWCGSQIQAAPPFGSVAFQMPSLFWLKKAAPWSVQSKCPAVCPFVALSVIYCVCYTYVWQKCCHTLVCGSPFIWPACGLHCGPLARTGRQQGLRIWTGHRALLAAASTSFLFFFATIMIKPWQILLSCFSFVDSESYRNLQLNLCSQPATLTTVWGSSDLSMEIKGNCKSTKVTDWSSKAFQA